MRSPTSATEGVHEMTFSRMIVAMLSALVGTLALVAVASAPAHAQAGKLVDFNTASEGDLQSLPNLTPDIVKGLVAKRPFKTIVDLNAYLVEQKLTPDQTKELYRKAFVPINLNTGTKEEFLLIPGVGPRMSGEFE